MWKQIRLIIPFVVTLAVKFDVSVVIILPLPFLKIGKFSRLWVNDNGYEAVKLFFGINVNVLIDTEKSIVMFST